MGFANTGREDRIDITGGRFVNPGYLPPTRTETIGGRFVMPASNRILPPVRTTRIQAASVDWSYYHFSGIAEEYHSLNRKKS